MWSLIVLNSIAIQLIFKNVQNGPSQPVRNCCDLPPILLQKSTLNLNKTKEDMQIRTVLNRELEGTLVL